MVSQNSARRFELKIVHAQTFEFSFLSFFSVQSNALKRFRCKFYEAFCHAMFVLNTLWNSIQIIKFLSLPATSSSPSREREREREIFFIKKHPANLETDGIRIRLSRKTNKIRIQYPLVTNLILRTGSDSDPIYFID